MNNCSVCGRELKNPKYRAAGVGPVCAKKNRLPDPGKAAQPQARIFFMSGPKTTAADRRTWLVRIDGEPSYLVRIYVDDEGRTASCDCPTGKNKVRCRHVDLMAAADAERFNLEQ
jgi:hypothetical protein